METQEVWRQSLTEPPQSAKLRYILLKFMNSEEQEVILQVPQRKSKLSAKEKKSVSKILICITLSQKIENLYILLREKDHKPRFLEPN